ncbi:hypothetical protein FDW84_18415 (plasmid) [Pseudarthrobacter sp. NamE5]|nr:hypothetical protein FDW84_18415 [Pseudarthrobacter sp. NamE5]
MPSCYPGGPGSELPVKEGSTERGRGFFWVTFQDPSAGSVLERGRQFHITFVQDGQARSDVPVQTGGPTPLPKSHAEPQKRRLRDAALRILVRAIAPAESLCFVQTRCTPRCPAPCDLAYPAAALKQRELNQRPETGPSKGGFE